jgi:sulfhydrogenase subunit gamma (sulfur reductase)
LSVGEVERRLLIYGARNPGLLIYKDELVAWAKRDDINLNVTVDKRDADWKGREGFVPTVCREVAPSSENAVTVICGPPIMIWFTLPVFSLAELDKLTKEY